MSIVAYGLGLAPQTGGGTTTVFIGDARAVPKGTEPLQIQTTSAERRVVLDGNGAVVNRVDDDVRRVSQSGVRISIRRD